ncbi:histidinol-phosphatase HisJ [Desertibacillus haloalkaliphilus]|uniref:histidinol-phosphatase HisJ n=1 Tax=Desertibacillus haloalkaliphilus TaxID=1328930 RepID=UPI001C25B19E|nr:histidinol-phosphatase HisJ [Desertibacillus haloalkaliphilus]MBU8905202.1 histidinol-phosphatase HisJ [Desertibacillus haloalkaliphilus]
MILYDGHVHTPFCPHGTKDTIESYIEQALAHGIKGLTFAEHAPLPEGFIDPTPLRDSAMKKEHLYEYIELIQQYKKDYKDKIDIRVGLEVDYIVGFEKETTALLNDVGPQLDDSLLSVHFLRNDDRYYCLDYSPEAFAEMIDVFGSIDGVYKNYFDTVKQSITANLGSYKPKRIGHITLVRKFQNKYPATHDFRANITDILDTISTRQLQLDYNGAGTAKPLCREPYPPASVVEEAIQRKIPLIYGSDAHSHKGLLQGKDQLVQHAPLVTPDS